MIYINNAQTIAGQKTNYQIASPDERVIDASGLTLFPGLIDPHVHFRTPGLEYKEDWLTGAMAAIAGGYTTVFDMPNTLPPTISKKLLTDKKNLINKQLAEIQIPLRYQLFFGADKSHFSEIHRVKNEIVGIKIFMGCSTGNLVVDDDESLHAVFAIASALKLLVAVHAEDEKRMIERKRFYQSGDTYHFHSLIRDTQVATIAVEKAIQLAKIYGTPLYILHVSTKEEIALIKEAKKLGFPIFAETTPHHLFLNDGAYLSLKGKVVVNPPLREAHQQQELFHAIKEGIIDTIGSDHAPHTLSEKSSPFGVCPSGMPGIETTLALLITAYHQGLLSLDDILKLTVQNAQHIFKLTPNNDVILVDLDKEKKIKGSDLFTKCGWSAHENSLLKGSVRYTLLDGQCFDIDSLRQKKG